jgi:DNA-binding NarL/FixJ family response regulator
MDVNMPGNVIKAFTDISQMNRGETRVLAFTAVAGVDYAIAALEAGAAGYILKGSTIEELKQAIRAVSDGETYISPAFANKVLTGLRTEKLRRTARENCRFSVREEQVVRLLMTGMTNREIAASLAISDKTVKHYMTIIMQKMNVRSRIEVVISAEKLGMTGKRDPNLPMN